MRASSPGDNRRGEMIAAARRWSRRPLERPRHRGRKRRLRPSHGRAQATPAALASRPAPPATRGRGLSRCGDQPSAHREDGAGATPPALPRAGLRRAAVGVRRGTELPLASPLCTQGVCWLMAPIDVMSQSLLCSALAPSSSSGSPPWPSSGAASRISRRRGARCSRFRRHPRRHDGPHLGRWYPRSGSMKWGNASAHRMT